MLGHRIPVPVRLPSRNENVFYLLAMGGILEENKFK